MINFNEPRRTDYIVINGWTSKKNRIPEAEYPRDRLEVRGNYT